MEGKIKIGPVGTDYSGKKTMVDWDEGSHNGIISQIFLSHGPTGVFSIQFQFMLDDTFFLSSCHGQNTGSMFDVVSVFCFCFSSLVHESLDSKFTNNNLMYLIIYIDLTNMVNIN